MFTLQKEIWNCVEKKRLREGKFPGKMQLFGKRLTPPPLVFLHSKSPPSKGTLQEKSSCKAIITCHCTAMLVLILDSSMNHFPFEKKKKKHWETPTLNSIYKSSLLIRRLVTHKFNSSQVSNPQKRAGT